MRACSVSHVFIKGLFVRVCVWLTCLFLNGVFVCVCVYVCVCVCAYYTCENVCVCVCMFVATWAAQKNIVAKRSLAGPGMCSDSN